MWSQMKEGLGLGVGHSDEEEEFGDDVDEEGHESYVHLYCYHAHCCTMKREMLKIAKR